MQLPAGGGAADLLRRLPHAAGASLRVAGAAIADFCQRHPSMEVTLVLYRQSIYDMAKRILGWEDAPS